MSKIRVIIVEDEFFVANHLKQVIIGLGYDVIKVFHRGEDVIAELNSYENVIFLVDIQLSGKLTGISVAQHLSKRGIPFVFLTANKDRSTLQEAVSTAPVSYIGKPFTVIDVEAALALAANQLDSKIKLVAGGEVIKLDARKIFYLKADNVYVEIYTEDKVSLLRRQLKELEPELPTNFIRCHRSYIVNMDKVDKIKNDILYLGDILIPVSRSYRDVVYKRI